MQFMTDQSKHPAWDLRLSLSDAKESPIYAQLAQAIIDEIRRGRLRPGQRLPGSRTLAKSLGIHRNTVISAYDELHAEGWTETQIANGTFVKGSLPETRFDRSVKKRSSEIIGFDLERRAEAGPPTHHKETLLLSGGAPDLRMLPNVAFMRAYRRAIRSHRESLNYGDPQGHHSLRQAIATMLNYTRGIDVAAEDVTITRGSQMALYLIGKCLISPGDTIAVEAFGYQPAWSALRSHGAILRSVPVDADGIRVDALEELCTTHPLRAVYVTPHHQYPTMVTLSAERRLALVALARRHRFAIIEDDYDHEFHYQGRPVAPIASSDTHGVVIYVGTLSKIFAPGIRIGYVVGPKELTTELTRQRRFIDRQGDLATEMAVAEMIEDGEVTRHANRMRRIYKARRDFLIDTVERHLSGVLSFEVPSGGLSLWARIAGDIDPEAWAERVLQRKVAIRTAKRFCFRGKSHPYLRLAFASLNEEESRRALMRLKKSL